MKSLNSFLKPKRKENLKFVLSDAFVGDDGKLIEWEMRQLSGAESLELQSEIEGKSYQEAMAIMVANSLVYPNLKDAELLKGLSEQQGKPIMKAVDALKLITTDAELGTLIFKYSEYNALTTDFGEKVEEAKN